MQWYLWHFYLIKEFFAFFLCFTWVHVSLYPLSGISWDICRKSLVKQQENTMSLTSVFILITFLLDDVWLLLGETRSWSLSYLRKIKLCFLPGFCLCHKLLMLLFVLLPTLWIPSWITFFVAVFSLPYVFLIFILLFSLRHLISVNKYTQNLSQLVSFSI